MILAKPKTATELIALNSIAADPSINPRAGGTSEELAKEYAEIMESSPEAEAAFWLVPPVVYRDRAGKQWLSEGFTRKRAMEVRGCYGMPCVVRVGERRDAALNAAGSNGSHGQRRTNPDIERAVEIVLGIEPNWTDRRIAEVARVTAPTVARVRQLVIDRNPAVKVLHDAPRIGRDGRTYQPPVKEVHTAIVHTGGPAIASPSKSVPLPPPDPRIGFEADLDVLCGTMLADCRKEIERLSFTAYGSTIGHKKALAALDAALAALWADRPGKPPG